MSDGWLLVLAMTASTLGAWAVLELTPKAKRLVHIVRGLGQFLDDLDGVPADAPIPFVPTEQPRLRVVQHVTSDHFTTVDLPRRVDRHGKRVRP